MRLYATPRFFGAPIVMVNSSDELRGGKDVPLTEEDIEFLNELYDRVPPRKIARLYEDTELEVCQPYIVEVNLDLSCRLVSYTVTDPNLNKQTFKCDVEL